MRTSDSLIPLPKFTLPQDYPWRTGLVEAIEQFQAKEEEPPHYTPPRFIGYYFIEGRPIAICRNLRVTLPLKPPVKFLANQINDVTDGQYRIVCSPGENESFFMLVHDRWDGSCFLYSFEAGYRFVTANNPILSSQKFYDT